MYVLYKNRPLCWGDSYTNIIIIIVRECLPSMIKYMEVVFFTSVGRRNMATILSPPGMF